MLIRFFDRITRLSLRFRWFVIAIAVAVLGGGIYAMLTLNLELLPSIEFPQTFVVVQWPDAESTDQFLEEITKPLEEALSEVEGVVNLESTTTRSLAFITARNEFGLNKDDVVADITAAVEAAELPEGVETPQIFNFGLGDLPVVVASASSGDVDLGELKDLVESDLIPILKDIENVERVTVSGGQELPEEGQVSEDESLVEGTSADEMADELVPLPEFLKAGAESYGVEVEYAQDITPAVLAHFVGAVNEEEMLQGLTMFQQLLPSLPAETLALLPVEFVDTLDSQLRQQLDSLAAPYGGIGQNNATEVLDILSKELARLPDEIVQGASMAGLDIEYAQDITPEFMRQLNAFGPQGIQALQLLTPENLKAMQPEVIALLPQQFLSTVDGELLAELDSLAGEYGGAGALAAQDTGDEQVEVDQEAARLPEVLIQGANSFGVDIEYAYEITPEFMRQIAAAGPQGLQILGLLTPDNLRALQPEVIAILPPEFVATLDSDLKDELDTLAAEFGGAGALAGQDTGEEETAADQEAARLPEVLIQGASSLGVDLEYAYEITPEFMRQIAAIGPQGLQVLGLLTPDNLRALQPEVIALLPPDFLATLDSDLREELDVLAAEFGGAGALVGETETSEEEESAPGAPALAGPWLEPAPNGTPSQFQTAADLVNNSFGVGAAQLLNLLPSSPEIDDPAPFYEALTPEVLAYLAENDEDFISSLSPSVLELMSQESLTFLLDTYPEQFDPALAERLADIAAGNVAVFVPESTITRTDNNPALILSLYKSGDANTVEVAHEVFNELDAYQSRSGDISFSYVFEQASFIEGSIEGVAREGLLGAFFAIVVILIFLSGRVNGRYRPSWRSTIVVGMSIPLSVFAAMLMMRVMPPTLGTWINDLANSTGNGPLTFIARLFPATVTLNLMTLSGMTVAIGRVVDDSIVVLENSYRFIQHGGDKRQAVLMGTKEVAIAIFASTATTIAVFLPLGLLGGIVGSFFLPFGLTVTYALAASFVVAITVVPALTYVLISKENIPEERETWMQRVYTPVLEWVLGHRAITMIIATVIFVASLFLLSLLPRSFIPEIGEPTINVSVELESGTTMFETDALARDFEAAVSDLHGVETVQAEVGSGGGFEAFFGGGGVTQNLANMTVSVENLDDLETLTGEVRELANDIFGEENTVVSAASQTGFSGFSLIVSGESMDELEPLAEDIKAAIESVDIDEDGVPEIVNVSSNIDQGAIGGNGTIIRIDGQPAISFSGELETDDTLGATFAAKQAVEELDNLPASAQVSEGFESEQQTQGFQQMIQAILYSIIIVYIIMALTFKSFIHPFTILFSLPFALVGASLALFLSNAVLSISAMIGLMMLVGIVVTNAIVLLELVQQLRQNGSVAHDALIQGGRTRLRPIWMTALAAVLALVPLALSQEGGALIASELATVVIGGLLVSTFLTLLVVPVVYSLFDQLGRRFRRSS